MTTLVKLLLALLLSFFSVAGFANEEQSQSSKTMPQDPNPISCDTLYPVSDSILLEQGTPLGGMARPWEARNAQYGYKTEMRPQRIESRELPQE